MPDNAYYLDREFGRRWDCQRGFQRVNDSCIAVALPDNAHLNYSGNDWDRSKPYRKRMEGCVLTGNE